MLFDISFRPDTFKRLFPDGLQVQGVYRGRPHHLSCQTQRGGGKGDRGTQQGSLHFAQVG